MSTPERLKQYGTRFSALIGVKTLVLAVVLMGSYWVSLGGGFVWDDLILIKKNPLVTGEKTVGTIWFSSDFSLSTVVMWLNWLGFGDEATGYRCVNLGLHFGSALLLWRILHRVSFPGAWWGAVLFAIHPIAVASVAWISELKNTLSLMFALASSWCYLEFQAVEPSRRSDKGRWLYGGALVSFALALLAKTSVVIIPVLWLGGHWAGRHLSRRIIGRLIPFFLLALAFGAMTWWFQSHQAIRGVTVQTGGGLERLADAGTALWFYLGKSLWPQNLSAIYPSWAGALAGIWRYVPLAAALLTLSAVVLLRQIEWVRRIGWALAAFVVCLLPVAGLIDMYFMIFSRVSDHFAYVALVVWGASVGGLLGLIKDRRWRGGIGSGLLLALALLTRERAAAYRSDEALWRDTIAKNPSAWNAHNNLACNLAEKGKLEEAITYFESSLALNPGNAEAHRNLAQALAMTGKLAEAAPHLRAALQIKPTDPELMIALAQVLAQRNELAEAATHLQKAIQLKPTTPLRLMRAAILGASNLPVEALGEYSEVLRTEPDSSEALSQSAWILATMNDFDLRDGEEAIRLAQRACEVTNHREPMALAALAAAQGEKGDFSSAITTAKQAMALAQARHDQQALMRNQKLLQFFERGLRYGRLPQP